MDVLLAVNGTLMRGLELNQNLLAVGARFVREAHTAPTHRLWSINDRHPAMIRVAAGGAAIAVEVWAVPAAGLASILLQEPPGECMISAGSARADPAGRGRSRARRSNRGRAGDWVTAGGPCGFLPSWRALSPSSGGPPRPA